MKPLLVSQKNKIEKFLNLKVGADFGEAGTGKTRSTLELVKYTEATDLLWVAPYGTINPPEGKGGIKEEVMKWLDGTEKFKVHFLAPESISASGRVFMNMMQTMRESGIWFMVVDESLKIKNWSAKRTHRIITMGKLAKYRFILNGTALSRSLMDLWAQMEFLSPRILNMSESQFKDSFCCYTTINKRVGKNSWRSKEFITGYENVEYLYAVIKPYVFDCDLHLEVGKKYLRYSFDLGEEEKKEYQRLKSKYLDDEVLMWKKNNIFLELTMKMQHGYCCSEEKFELLDVFLKKRDRSKVIIYRKFIKSESELKKRYSDIPILSIQSHTMSLNLQEFNTVVFWDKTWDYATVDQAEHRTYRVGQKEDCTYLDLDANVPLDGLMMSNIEKKGRLLRVFKEKGVDELKKIL